VIRPVVLLAASSLAVGLAAATAVEAATARARDKDIVVLRSERWIDTVQGSLKNLASVAADEVVVMVRFLDRRRKALGTETVKVGPLDPGQERDFQVPMPERVRKAASWEIVPRARWAASRR